MRLKGIGFGPLLPGKDEKFWTKIIAYAIVAYAFVYMGIYMAVAWPYRFVSRKINKYRHERLQKDARR